MTIRLDEPLLGQAVEILRTRDKDLARIVTIFGLPPLWQRQPGFGTLVHIILEQQVSLASARAAFDKLVQATQELSPTSFLQLSDIELKRIGFSRQKTAYGRYLAAAVLEGSLDLVALSDLDDDRAREQLLKIKGIGPWTADIYLLMALGRPDVWPRGDLALAVAAQRLWALPARPSCVELDEMSLGWRPWRAVAARILWHFYLSTMVRSQR